jgi:hypothetical protein
MAQGACLLEEFLSAPTLKSSFKRHAPSFMPRPNPTSQMSFTKSRLALVLLFLTTLFTTVFRANISPLDRLMSASSFSTLRQRKCSLIGSLSSQTLATSLASGQSRRKLRLSVGRSQEKPRLFISFDITQRSSLGSHQVWIQGVSRSSINQTLQPSP